MTFRVHTRPDFISKDLEIYIIHEAPDGSASVVKSLEMHKLKPGESSRTEGRLVDRFFGGNRAFLQAMLDGAWDAGLRPTGYGNVAESLKASDAHLQDMRAIAFGKLEIQKP